MKKNNSNPESCHCGSGKLFTDCCLPYIEKQGDAPTAEILMRSRYSAFVMRDETYLRYSWHPDYCPKNIHLNDSTRWLGLKIIRTASGGENAESGEVEFVARSKNNGKASRLHENSRFCRFQSRWVYIDGKID